VQITTGAQRTQAGTTAHPYLTLITRAKLAEPTILANSTGNDTTGAGRRTAAWVTAVWLSQS